ncbi:thiamine biosynthesis protein ThiS [Pseudooceanicola batsensis HTCC2597]|uniref:Thiamine biosynthesis protein ThiS n=1 Tax=Pseudooceanicola batsensis (strain ATCC BAA-863 / DSM 15984 / KCTC 12145 / HTCC2597) TaxID=252305 RepID=A3TXE5_PSEBH|nr:sulfur carrier protein ThiS [Pseudooceanicola batsensis]EAQ03505.1 thiamine biosynthesis protein ThiS [Pseudooceanicola batsensis HTCC2597]
MKIMVNGAATEVRAGTLAQALDELGYGEAKVATAVNESFVSTAARGQTALEPGDRVEIVAPRQGG